MIFDRVYSVARRVLKRGPGYVDRLDAERAAGWLAPPPGDTSSARLSLHVDGHHEMNILADLERSDVMEAGLGPLHCGFDVALPRRLRDGAAHLIELRVGADGPVLHGGRLRIEAGSDSWSAATAARDARPREGLVFFEGSAAAIGGWAMGCGAVQMSLDDGPPEILPLDREVPGFGKGNRFGFRAPVPAALMDGAWHEAELRFGEGGDMLGGSPLRFRLMPDRPSVELGVLSGRMLELCLRRRDGSFSDHAVAVLADGQPLAQRRRDGWIELRLPDGAQHLAVVLRPAQEVSDPETETKSGLEPDLDPDLGPVLARYVVGGVAGGAVPAEWPLPGSPVDDTLALSDDAIARAIEAFAAFCATPDARFDPLWYARSYLQTGAGETALAHYRDSGARAGLSPGPYFDEASARRLHPGLAAKLGDGRLPCLFAVELLHGPGTLGSLTGLDPQLRAMWGADVAEAAVTDPGALLEGAVPELVREPAAPPPAAPPLPTRLPPPAELRDPAKSIYAAWLARLDVSPAERAEIAADEDAVRRDIATTPLYHRPLVSIIMPTWNRAFTIGEAIQSALDQSYGNWELLVCDDASEDRTAQVVHGFDDPRIRYMKFLKSNGAGARNKGLRFARGDYIAYLDSDNIWHPLFLEMMLRQLLARPGRAIAYCAYLDTEITGARVALQAISRPPFRPVRLASKNFMDLNSIVHHRRIYDWLGGFDNALPRLQDWDLMLRYTAIFRPHYVNRIGVFYRRNVAWGQVTHLFQNSSAQDRVAEKSQRRQAGIHEGLKIAWPARARVTVLSGAGLTERMLAESLARLAAASADVDLVIFGQEDGEEGDHGAAARRADDPVALTRVHLDAALAADPGRAGYVLASRLAAQPVFSVGVAGSMLRAFDGLDPARCLRLRGTGEGIELVGLADPGLRFYLGALPLDLPEASSGGAARAPVLCLQGGEKSSLAAARFGLDLLEPDPSGRGPDGLAQLGAAGLVVSLQPVSALDPYRFSLLATLQGRGVPVAVPVDAGRARSTGNARQWIEARAAYELKKTDPAWVFDKCRKLLDDGPTLTRMRARSRVVHAIAQHPDLVRARLADALYQMLFGQALSGQALSGPQAQEMIDDRN